ncbi:DEHA2G18678p [Pseudozyma hubeiensis SY62]|uniref:DEHA2G18678p n=1 Tax=Pseudozyma hubeiensis (strain SY62) TaxID=1305764 RepID=R9PE11_PSEHS|nr:DEHA2G18678p [Pseudozyma hubeiensis SY62]GAC99596.1 DEHA2G18678p [Pseudozyma hubeiensis SY62]
MLFAMAPEGCSDLPKTLPHLSDPSPRRIPHYWHIDPKDRNNLNPVFLFADLPNRFRDAERNAPKLTLESRRLICDTLFSTLGYSEATNTGSRRTHESHRYLTKATQLGHSPNLACKLPARSVST